MVTRNSSTLIGVVHCDYAELRGPSGKPFFVARLVGSEAQALLAHLRELANRNDRSWFILSSTTPDPKRLRIVDLDRTPEYEEAAARHYLRGEVFRVTGKDDSCNINFSGPIGATLLAHCLEGALNRMKEYIELVVPNRHGKRDLVEFIPDVDIITTTLPEHEGLALAGEAAAVQVLEQEDFSDWE